MKHTEQESTCPETLHQFELVDTIYEHVRQGNGLDFVCQAKTPWHALGVDAELESSTGESGIVLIVPHQIDGYLLSPSSFESTKNHDIKFYRFSVDPDRSIVDYVRTAIYAIFGQITPLLTGRGEIRVIVPGDRTRVISRAFAYPSVCNSGRPRYVSIDEGLGRYFDFNKKEMSGGNKRTESHLAGFYRRILQKTKKAYLNSVPQRNNALFRVVDEELLVNKDILRKYRRVLPAVENVDGDVDGLILTQPFVERDRISETSMINLVRDTMSKFGPEQTVALKPHPRENIGRYDEISEEGLDILNDKVPFEKLFPAYDPGVVVGFTSTALVTANLFYDVKAISAVDLLRQRTDDSHLLEMCSQFEKLTSRYVSFE